MWVDHHIETQMLRSGLLRLLLAFALCCIGTGLSPRASWARLEPLAWTHPTPALVEGFEVRFGTSSGVYETVIDVGNVFSADIEVPDGDTIYLVVRAYNNTTGQVSPPSNEIVRFSDPGGGGGSGGNQTLWSEDFETSSIGSFVPEWLDTDADNSMVENDALFEIADVAGSRVLRTQSTLTNIHSHYVVGGSSSWSNYQVRGRVRVTASASRTGLTSHSQYPFDDAYYGVSTHWTTGEFEIHGHPNPWPGPEISCSPAGTGVFLQPNTWFWLALQVQIGAAQTDLRAKAWQDGQPEPAAWQAHCWHDDAFFPAQGTIGVQSGNSGTKYWDDLEVTAVPEAGPAALAAGLLSGFLLLLGTRGRASAPELTSGAHHVGRDRTTTRRSVAAPFDLRFRESSRRGIVGRS